MKIYSDICNRAGFRKALGDMCVHFGLALPAEPDSEECGHGCSSNIVKDVFYMREPSNVMRIV